jgi:flagellar basal body-associated protein FliL
LLITTVLLVVVTALAYVGYIFVLGQSVPAVQGSERSSFNHANEPPPLQMSTSRSEVSL